MEVDDHHAGDNKDDDDYEEEEVVVVDGDDDDDDGGGDEESNGRERKMIMVGNDIASFLFTPSLLSFAKVNFLFHPTHTQRTRQEGGK